MPQHRLPAATLLLLLYAMLRLVGRVGRVTTWVVNSMMCPAGDCTHTSALVDQT